MGSNPSGKLTHADLGKLKILEFAIDISRSDENRKESSYSSLKDFSQNKFS